jgi:hypothetical protein
METALRNDKCQPDVCVYAHTLIDTYDMDVCMRACMYICMCVYMYPRICVCIHIYLYVCMYRARSLSLAHTQRKRQRARARASDRVQEKARARERAHMHCAHLLDASLELIEAERVAVAIDRSYALRLHPPTHPATHAHLCVCVCVFVNVRRDMPLSLSFPACSLARARTLICRT